ncbi:MAG TPA: hypothetical protein VGS10_04035 [Terracidiphilus sp.]|nr:hypothetical protein [Terracidiphilus sp.]
MNSKRKQADAIPAEDCWKLMERAAASAQLKRAARAREFLFYVGTKTLKEGCTEIHEQEIGHAVFGREPDYETSLDNIVRVSATDLRKRIEGYFATEGADEPLIFEIPRGSYMPVFRWRPEEDPQKPPDGMAEAAAPPARVPYYHQAPILILAAVSILLAVGCGLLWRQNRNLSRPHNVWEGKPALTALWPRFLNSSRPTDVILADDSYDLVENIAGESFSLNDYLNRSYMDKIEASNLSADRKADLRLIIERSHGGIGDFNAAQRIWALNPSSPRLNLLFARNYSADLIKRDNAILIGGQEANPWVNLFANQLNFTIAYNHDEDRSYVINSKARRGEQAIYPVLFRPDGIVGYGIVAYLPNPSHTADALIIAGTDSQTTDAAAEFVTSESRLEQLFKKFPSQNLPYFEVLLRTSRLSGTPLTEQIVMYRTH